MSSNQELTVPVPSGRTCPVCGLRVETQVTVCPRDGTNLVNPLHIDPVFANYELLASIGAGGMGVIYKARHRVLNKLVAVKTIHSYLATPEAVKRFEIEGKAASQLAHPGIIDVHDYGLTQSGQPYMIMDFVNGQTMSEALRKFGQLPERFFLPIFIQVCDALSHAHKRSVLHRDIKPSNIMLVLNEDKEYDVCIMDFGIAKLVNDTESGAQALTKTGDAIGSPIYMSPEQARGIKLDHRSDLYSLGCVMYEALTGSPPFLGNTALDTMLMHMEQKPLPLREASMGTRIDPRIEKIVMRLLEKDPANRYQSMDEVKRDLIALRDPATQTLPSVQSAKDASREQAKSKKSIFASPGNRVVLSVVAGMSVLALAVVAMLMHLNQKPAQLTEDASTIETDSTIKGIAALNKKTVEEMNKKAIKTNTPSTSISPAEPQKSKTDFVEGELLPDAKQGLIDAVEGNNGIIVIKEYYANADKITDADLSILKKAKMARIISLQDLHITDTGLDSVSDLKTLMTLTVSGTHVKTLRAVAKLTGLKNLFANDTPLAPVAFQNIGKVKNLVELHLDHTPITDADVPYLYGLTKLTFFDLHDCDNLSTLGADKLRNHLPPTCFFNYSPRIEKGLSPMRKFQEAKGFVAAGEWSKANDVISQAIAALPTNYDPESRVKIFTLKGDCQVQFKLYQSAAFYYEQAMKSTDSSSSSSRALCTKLAACYEAMSAENPTRQFKETNLGLAVELRSKASTFFEGEIRAGGDEKSVLKVQSDKNVAQLAIDKKKLAEITSARK